MHKKIFDYIKRCCGTFVEYIYIEHSPDDVSDIIIDNGIVDIINEDANCDFDDKYIPKKHMHMMFKVSPSRSTDSILSKFVIWDKKTNKYIPYLHYVKGIYYPMDYLEYMLHRDIKSVEMGKVNYSVYSLCGESKNISKLLKRDLYFVSNAKELLFSWLNQNQFGSYCDFQRYTLRLRNSDPADYFILEEYLKTNSYECKSIINSFYWSG